jgi:hypothetical protein
VRKLPQRLAGVEEASKVGGGNRGLVCDEICEGEEGVDLKDTKEVQVREEQTIKGNKTNSRMFWRSQRWELKMRLTGTNKPSGEARGKNPEAGCL